MEDGDNQTSQPAADKREEDSTNVHAEENLREEDQVAAANTIDSVVNAFFAARGGEGDGSAADESVKNDQAATDLVAEREVGDSDGEERTSPVDRQLEEEEEVGDGGDGAQAMAAAKSQQMPERQLPGKGAGDEGIEVGDGGDEFTPAQVTQSPREAGDSDMQKSTSSDHDGDTPEALSPAGTEPTDAVPNTDDVVQTEEVVNASNDNADENQEGSGSVPSDAWNSSVGSGEEDAGTGRQQDDSDNTGAVSSGFDSQEASLVAQGLVHDVLDKVLRTEAETGENDTDTEDPELRNTSQFPELEKVDLNSEDWDHDFRARASTAQDDVSLSSSEDENDRKQSYMQAVESEQTADGRARETNGKAATDADPEPSDGDHEQHASPRLPDSTRNDTNLPPQSAGKVAVMGTVAGEQVPYAASGSYRQMPDQRERQESVSGVSPKPEYPINYNNYKVCRVVSPGVKECLILETGEQVLYDCGKCGRSLDAHQVASSTARHTPTQAERERVKRDLFSDGERVESPAETALAPPGAPSSHSEPTPATHNLPSAPHDRPSQLEESHDGSYLWLQQQVQWRAGSTALPAPRVAREPARHDHREPARHDTREPARHDTREPARHDLREPARHDTREPARHDTREPARHDTREPARHDTREPARHDYREQARHDYREPARRDLREPARRDGRDTSPISTAERETRRADRSSVLAESREGRTGGGLSMSGSADTSGSVSSPGAIPNFKTLQDQQVSWLSMYRMLEQEHRGELRAQYTQHQRIISDMQRHLEGDLINQQTAIREKLHTHREALMDKSPGGGLRESHKSSAYSSRNAPTDAEAPRRYAQHSSHLEQDEGASQQYVSRLPSHFESSTRSAQEESRQRSSRDSHRSRAESGGEKRLRGGVYSSPMPLGKTRLSQREVSDEDVESRQRDGESDRPRWSQTSLHSHTDHTATSSQSPLQDQVLSPRTRLSLREKHAKHMADLRAYYEAEVQDLRHKLGTLTGDPLVSSSVSGGRETARERILQEEIHGLRQQLRELQDSLDDAHIHNRELEQKLQGLEIRAADYAERYEESQQNVLKLKNRLEELHSYAKDRESVLEQVQSSERRQAAALQEMYKAQEEQGEAARRDKTALKRLLDKYEMLEKDYHALKGTSTDFEKKLFETRTEAVELNKVISQLELDNKRLTHENDNMRHRLAISGSLPLGHHDVYEPMQQRERLGDRFAHSTGSMSNRHSAADVARSPIRQDRTPPRRVASDEEDHEADHNGDSPLLRAERELRRLQQTMGRGDFVPRLQPKKYSSTNSLGPVNGDVVIIDALSSPTRNASSACNGSRPKEGRQKEKKITNTAATRERGTGGQSKQTATNRAVYGTKSDNFQSTALSSPTRFDVGLQQTAGRRERETSKEQAGERSGHGPLAKSTAAKGGGESSQIVDSTLKLIQSGDIVSRPQWEDVYTSLAKPAQPDNKTSTLNMTQEEILRDRIRSIDQLEHRYDNLQAEKRKLESQLNKLPSHGRDRKTRREKELLEETLDSVDHELGSLRMTLKRYQVLKTTY